MTEVTNPSTHNPEIGSDAFVLPEYAIGEQFISASALSALQAYSETTSNRRAYEHPLRVANILHDFMGGELASSVYDVAALHDLAQRVTAEADGYDVAAASLRDYKAYASQVRAPNPRMSLWDYTSTALADMDMIEDCSQRGRRLDTGDTVVSDLLRSRTDVPVPERAWSIPSELVPLDKIEELLRNVNLESALVKAGEMLDNLRHPSPKDRAVLQDVIDAESFYAPLCEAMGFDGLSMALRSEAAIIRLRRSGREDTIAAAEDALTGLGDSRQVLSDVTGLFEHLLGSETDVESPLQDTSGHGIKLGSVVVDTHQLNERAKVSWAHWRVKSLGSLALKLIRKDEQPMDVLGLTIVVDNLDELALTYKSIVERVRANRVVEERCAPGREQSFSVQGEDSYIEAVTRVLDESAAVSRSDIEKKPKINGHQVVKATFVYLPHVIDAGRPEDEIRVELVVQTEEDWHKSRSGIAAHLLYKAGKIGDEMVIQAILKRRQHLKSPLLNPRSHMRGEKFRSLVELAA